MTHAIGIDFGTTCSWVSVYGYERDTDKCIPNNTTSSSVTFIDHGCLIDDDAKISNPIKTVFGSKCLICCNFKDFKFDKSLVDKKLYFSEVLLIFQYSKIKHINTSTVKSYSVMFIQKKLLLMMYCYSC